MRQFHKTLKKLLSSIFKSARETARFVTIILVSPCSPSQARPLPEFYSTASLYIFKEVSFQRASVASWKNVGLLTWCLLLDSSKRSVRNRMLTYTPPMSIWLRPLILSAEMGFGESWQNMDAPRNLLPLYDSFMMACWLESKIMVRYPSHSLSQTEWSKDVSLPPPFSALCFLPCWQMLQRYWCRNWHQLPHWQFCLQPQEASSKNQGHIRYHQWLPVCWWLCPQCYFRSWHATQHWQVCWGLQLLWPHNQYKEDWSYAPASPWKDMCWTQHHNQWEVTEHSGQVHLPWQHTHEKCCHWWWSECQTC